MLIFEDVISGDELLSDAYDVKLVDGAVYEADCAMVTVGNGDIDIGANPSAEDGEEALEDGAETVNNVVYSFRLQPTMFDKKSFTTYIKGYMKRIKAYLAENDPDSVEAFEKVLPLTLRRFWVLSKIGNSTLVNQWTQMLWLSC